MVSMLLGTRTSPVSLSPSEELSYDASSLPLPCIEGTGGQYPELSVHVHETAARSEQHLPSCAFCCHSLGRVPSACPCHMLLAPTPTSPPVSLLLAMLHPPQLPAYVQPPLLPPLLFLPGNPHKATGTSGISAAAHTMRCCCYWGPERHR